MSRTFIITRTYDLLDAIANCPEKRVQQAVYMRLAGTCGATIAYTALGLAAKMASAIRTGNGIDRLNEAFALMDEAEQRTWAMDQIGVEFTSREDKIRMLLRLKDAFDNGVRQAGWQEYQGRTIEDELKRTTDPRDVRDTDVAAVVEHFDGDVNADDVKTMLKQDAAMEAARNAERIDAALRVLADIEIKTEHTPDEVHFSVLPEQLRTSLLTSARSGIMKLETDLLTNRVRAGSAIEKLTMLSVAKALRKDITTAVEKLQQPLDLMAA